MLRRSRPLLSLWLVFTAPSSGLYRSRSDNKATLSAYVCAQL